MLKKTLIGIWVGAAGLTLACLCCPTSLLSRVWAPGPVASASPASIPPLESTVSPLNSPVCTNSLVQLLHRAENDSYPGPTLTHEVTLITYTVSGDTLIDPVYASHVPDNLKATQRDTAGQDKLWHFVTDILPADHRSLITRFVIYTDGVSNSLGAVEQTDDPNNWMLELDVEDADDFPTLSTTLVHEFGHLLTLNTAQVTPDYEVFNHPDDQRIYNREAAACSSYFMYEGCSQPDSYINLFFQQFWPTIYTEWQAINSETDQDTLDHDLDDFYQENADEFVSAYAATSPEEDIAESFMYFIFMPKPSGANLAEEKYGFFYKYPQMISLREYILKHLCTYVVSQ